MSETLQEIFITYILPAIALILTSIAGWIGTVIVKYLSDKTESNKIKDALEEARKDLMTAVGQVMQTYVNSLKESGEWNEDSEEKARQEALMKAKLLMGPLTWKTLNQFFIENDESTLTEWCMAQIESFIEPVKKVRADRKLVEAELENLLACREEAA